MNKDTLTVTADDSSRLVGLLNLVFRISLSCLVGTDSLSSIGVKPTAVCSATRQIPAGFYDIIVSSGEAANYTFVYINGKLHVIDATGIAE